MDKSALVGDEISDGRRFIERFAADGNSVEAAFWVKTDEDELWFLYVVTDLVDLEGPAAAYRAINESLKNVGECWITSSEIKAIGPRNPTAKDVLAIMARYPGRLPARFGGRTLGSMSVDQLYIYPPSNFTFAQVDPMTTEDLTHELVRLMNRGPGFRQASRVALKDGTTFSGVPFSIEVGPQDSMVVRFIADGEPAPRVIQLDDIASIT